ncbi:MAG: cation diffusion facilitator family transporter [Frankia sp.]
MPADSKATVRLAFLANLTIAAAKTAAGLLSGSSAMISEAAHSWADTLNEVFLITSLRKSGRPADAAHPFGYGKERFFWSLLAAFGIFVTGGLFSIYEGVHALESGHRSIGTLELYLSYGVLAFSAIAEGSSLTRALRQVRSEAAANGRGFFEQFRRGDDPSVKTVVSEDSAAVIGLALAAGGLTLHKVTGSAAFDAAASIAIGVLLVAIAYGLGRDSKDLLIGEAADPEVRTEIFTLVSAMPEIDGVLELLTMKIGPDDLLVAMKVDLTDDITGDEVEDLSTRIDTEISAAVPSVRQVFVDATRPTGSQRLLADTVRYANSPDDSVQPPAGLL